MLYGLCSFVVMNTDDDKKKDYSNDNIGQDFLYFREESLILRKS